MKLVVPLLAVVAACAGPDDGVLLLDASVSTDARADAALIDAPIVLPDAPPSEVCSSGGWCQDLMPPSYASALSITPGGQPWIASYGVYAKQPTGWQHHEPKWDDFTNPFVFHTELYTVHALSSTDVWIGGRQGYVGHFTGGTWTEHRVASPSPQGIYGASANDVWVLYDSGLRYRWNGTTLTSQPSSQVYYKEVFGVSANDIWGFGETRTNNVYRPAIDHFDGTAWTLTELPGYGEVLSFWASGPDDLYAVIRHNGTTRLVHGDGTTWTTVTDPDVVQIFAVWVRSANDVWAVGAQGRIVRFDGQTWTPSASGTSKSLWTITGTATTMWVAGDGVALHRP